MAFIKNYLNNLRTKLSAFTPNLFTYSKLLLVVILSGIAYALYFIGVAAEYSIEFLTKIKTKIKEK